MSAISVFVSRRTMANVNYDSGEKKNSQMIGSSFEISLSLSALIGKDY
jgi:hypothetical protein